MTQDERERFYTLSCDRRTVLHMMSLCVQVMNAPHNPCVTKEEHDTVSKLLYVWRQRMSDVLEKLR